MNLTNFRTITIDVGTANEPIPPTILSASDHDGRIVKVRLFDGPSATSESGLGARLLYTTPDGVGGYATMAAVTGEPTLSWSVPVPTEALAPGRRTMAVQITDGTRIVTTRTFDVIVEPYLIDEDSPEAQDSLSEFRAAVEMLGGLTIPIPVNKGGSGLTSSPSMLVNLGSTSAANVMQASPRPGVTGTLPIANGGTGATTAAGAPWIEEVNGSTSTAITRSSLIDQSTASGTKYADALIWTEAGGETIAHDQVYQNSSRAISHDFGSVRQKKNDTTWTWYSNAMTVAVDGTVSYVVASPTAFRNAIGAFSSSGGDISGDTTVNNKLVYVDSNEITDGTAPSQWTQGKGVVFRDSANKVLGQVRPTFSTNGDEYMLFGAHAAIGGVDKDNVINLGFHSDGTRYVVVSDQAAWRNAINAEYKQTASTATVTLDSTKFTGSVKFRKVGHVAKIFVGNLKAVNNITSRTSIGTAPVGFRPSEGACFVHFNGNSSTYLILNTDGSITLDPVNANIGLYGGTCYLVD